MLPVPSQDSIWLSLESLSFLTLFKDDDVNGQLANISFRFWPNHSEKVRAGKQHELSVKESPIVCLHSLEQNPSFSKDFALHAISRH